MNQPERTFAQVLGIILAVIGLLGFVPTLAPNGYLLGIFAVDPVHNLVHLLTGLAGIVAGFASTAAWARLYAGVFGVVYALITLIGFVQGDTVLGLIRINGADNLLHLVIAVASLAVFFAATNRVRAQGGALG